MSCNCNKYEQGGTIEKTRTFNEFEFNKLVDRDKKEFFGFWSGYLWDITHKSSSDIVGKFNPKTKVLYIFGNSDLSNPLVKWLQDNSKVSREEYQKLFDGGQLDEETINLIETLQPLADSGDENAKKLIESLRGNSKSENKYEFVYSVTAIRDNGVNKILEDVLAENENTNKEFSIDYERKYKLIDRGFNKVKLRVNVLINGDKLDSYYDFRTSLSIHDLTEINSIIKNLFFIHSTQRKDFSRYLLNNEYFFTENVNESLNKIESDLKNRNDRYDVNSYVVKVKDATIIETKNFTKQDYEPFYYAKTDNKKKLITIFEPNPNNPFDRDDKTLFKEITFKELNKYTRNQLDLPNAQKRYGYLSKLPVIKNELKDKFSKDIPIGQQLKVYLDQEFQKNYETVYFDGGRIKGYNQIKYDAKDWDIYYSIEKSDDYYGKRTFDDIVIVDSDGNEVDYMNLPNSETDIIHGMIEDDIENNYYVNGGGVGDYMTVYRLGEIPYDEDSFFVAPTWRAWITFYSGEPIYEIKTKKLYLPLTNKSFKSWDELRSKANKGIFTEKDLSYIYPEESGIQNFEQYEISPNDIIGEPIQVENYSNGGKYANGGGVKTKEGKDLIEELKKGLRVRFLRDTIKNARWETDLYYENGKIIMWRTYYNADMEEVEGKEVKKEVTEKEANSLYTKDKEWIVEEYYSSYDNGGGVGIEKIKAYQTKTGRYKKDWFGKILFNMPDGKQRYYFSINDATLDWIRSKNYSKDDFKKGDKVILKKYIDLDYGINKKEVYIVLAFTKDYADDYKLILQDAKSKKRFYAYPKEVVFYSDVTRKYAKGGGVGNKNFSPRMLQKMAYKQAKSDIAKHYYKTGDPFYEHKPSDEWRKWALPYDTIIETDKPFKNGGYIGEISKTELETMVGRKLNGWNDDEVVFEGKVFKKCYLRPYYTKK